MGSRERNVELARDGLAAYNRGDVEAALAIFDPEIECHVSPSLMNAGTWRGLEGYWEMIKGWTEAWSDLVFEPRGFEAVDDRHVLADIHQTAIGRESRVPVELDVVLLFDIVGERARRFQIHPDRESALAAI